MTNQEKVRKIYPNAICHLIHENGQFKYHVIKDGDKLLSHRNKRESWAWSEVVRILKGINKL